MQLIRHPLLSPAPGTQRELVSLHYGQAGGQKAYIQASLHGDELPGMLVAHHLRLQLDALEAAGQIGSEIVLVPMANPIGLSQFLLHAHLGRFELMSGENFNRHYPDQIAAVARSLRIRTRSAPIRSLLSAAYIAAFRAISALPSPARTSRIRSRSASTIGAGFRHSLRVRPSAEARVE